MRAVEETMKTVCTQKDVRCVSFRELADWLDVQDPGTLKKLRGLGVGKAPKGGWASFAAATAAASPAATAGRSAAHAKQH